jgi:serine-type D-Ala-D-Ala carboxypeptidase/endopeptidase (penicillin-binding protein 4)
MTARTGATAWTTIVLLAGCAARRQPAAPSAPVAAPRVDTVVRQIPAPPCPPPISCPPPIDPRLHGLPRGIDTTLWLSLDSLSESDYLSRGGILGAYVGRLRDTVPVWRRLPDARLLPASTQKIFTASAALSELGPTFRWRTTLWAVGTVKDSVLHGDLILEGGGDPTLGMADGPKLGGIAAAVARAGIRRVQGNLVALDTLVGRGPDAWPQGWTVGSSRDGYGSPVLGLNWNQNRIGDNAIAEPRPAALRALRKALLARRIAVSGTDTTVRARGDSMGSRRNWTRLGTVSSPQLEPLLRVCLKESVNPFAEAMLLGLGLGRRGPAREAGRRHLAQWLRDNGMDLSRLIVDDGSGLSRYDQVSARQMALMLAKDAGGKGVGLISLLPRGGEGTLRRRFRNLPNPALVAAKTGTLTGVSNLAGYLVRPGRKDTLVFSFLCNGFSGSPRPVRLFQDRLLALLSGVPLRPVAISDTLDTAATRTPTDTAETDDTLDSTDSADLSDSTAISKVAPSLPATAPVPPVIPTPPAAASAKDSPPPQAPAPDSASRKAPPAIVLPAGKNPLDSFPTPADLPGDLPTP